MKTLLLLLCMTASIFAIDTSKVLTTETKDETTIVTAQAPTLKVGEEAYIVRKLQDGTSIIGFHCLLKSQQDTLATFYCEKFDGISQEAMPKINFQAQVGDTLVLNPMKKRALIITTSQNKYLKLRDYFKEYNLVHPDLFAASLYEESNPLPTRHDFQNFCKQYYVATLIFDLADGIKTANCQSFEILQTFRKKSLDEHKQMKPFFHRLDTITPGFWNWFGATEIEDFHTYYKELLNDVN